MTLRRRVEELTETYLNDSKRSIGEFVLREMGQIREYGTRQIAEQTDTSILYILNVLFSVCFQREYDKNLQKKVGSGRF